VWAERFIAAEDVEVCIHGTNVDRSVRREGDAVNTEQGATFVYDVGDLPDWIDSTEDVGCMRYRHQACPVPHQGNEILQAQLVSVGRDIPELDLDANAIETEPRSDVRFVSLLVTMISSPGASTPEKQRASI